MFDQLIESSSAKRSITRFRYFAATAALWTLGLAAAICVAILSYEANLNFSDGHQVILLPPPLPAGNDNRQRPREAGSPAAASANAQRAFSQRSSPTEIPAPSPFPPSTTFVSPEPGDVNAGGGPGPYLGGGGNPFGISNLTSDRDMPPPPRRMPAEPERAEVAPPPVVPKASHVLHGTAINRVQPVYPRLATIIRVGGQVVVEVVIDEEGKVIAVRALSGHPLLKESSVAAAWGWRWKPTYLNGVPVKVTGTITFNYVRGPSN